MTIDSNIVSGIMGLVGAAVGGLVTIFVAIYTLNKQFEYTQKVNKEAENKLIKNSLSIVLNELCDNHVLANTLLNYFNEAKLDDKTEASIEKFKYTFENSGWKDYKNNIILFLEEKQLNLCFNWLYMQISKWNKVQKASKIEIIEYLKQSDKLSTELRKMIDSL